MPSHNGYEYEPVDWADRSGNTHHGGEVNFDHADRVTLEITRDEWHDSKYVTLAGPWDDFSDFEEWVDEWFDWVDDQESYF